MLHGVSNSSNCFIVNMCTKPPAFIMADAHFDVWFLNHRGTHISRGHETLNPETDDEYWEFNMAEMVLYDLPDSISFIKQYTGVEKLGLIGHSQGGMVVLWAISLIPEIEKDVTVAVCMGVTAGLIRTKSFYLDTITSSWFISLLKLTGEKVYSDWSDDTWLAKFVYLYPSVADYLGQDIFDIDLNGGDPKNLAVYTHRIRGGTSLANLECWKDVKEKGNLFPEMCD